MKKNLGCIFLFYIFLIFNTSGQTNESIFYQAMQGYTKDAMGKNLVFFGKKFIGYPYIKKPLETKKPIPQKKIQEGLVVNLKKFDCISFIEQIIALNFTYENSTHSFSTFKNHLRTIRYRNGVIEYPERLHYFTDWIFEMEQNGWGKNITQEIGGELYENPVSIMTQKKELYPQMQDITYYTSIQKVEASLNKRKHYYIPKHKIAFCEKKMKAGDVIGITALPHSAIDVLHTGFIVFQNGRAYMLHASSEFYKVMITDVPLETYLEEHKKFSGIIVMRVLPKKDR